MQKTSEKFDVLIVGGGIIGLSLAWELTQQGVRVCLTDRRDFGREASWAAAGMLPPGPPEAIWPRFSSLDQLAGLSERLHGEWHDKLREFTGIDTGYRKTGALYLPADENGPEEQLVEKCKLWDEWGIEYHRIDQKALSDVEPLLSTTHGGVLLPAEAQLRAPRHLKALEAACLKSGVHLEPNCQVLGFEKSGNRLQAALSDSKLITADQFCLTAGCWTGQIAESLDLEIPLRPVRGQVLLLEGPSGLLKGIINVGQSYLMPRTDGSILVGATQEEVGFNQQTTAEAKRDLLKFAHDLFPALRDFQLKHHWAGLRPATPDGQPFLGKLPQLENAWIAAGHFRAGIQLSTGTAVVMRSLMLGQTPEVNVDDLDNCRGQGESSRAR